MNRIKCNRNRMFELYKEHIDSLIRAFPEVFNKDNPQILPIGVHKQLINYVSFSEDTLSAVLQVWTHRCEYKAKMSCGGLRFDLNGCAVSAISKWEVENAVKWVCRFRKKSTIESAQAILDKHMTEIGYEIWNKTGCATSSPYKIQ